VAGDKGSPLLDSQADAANVATLLKYAPNAPTPAFFTTAGANSSKALISQMLTAFPQYGAVADTWGNVGNFNYNSLQIALEQRTSRGLTFTVNYTYAKNLGDDGTYRSGWALPASAISRSTSGATLAQNRIDRSWTAISSPQTVNAFGVYQLPFGKGHIGGDNTAVRWLAGGWQLSGVYTYNAGSPVAATLSGTTGGTASGSNIVGQGTAMPDMNPAYLSSSARQNGSYGSSSGGTNACNIGIGAGCHAIQYINPNAFATPINVSKVSAAQYLIGNAPRTAPYALRNPGTENLNAGLRRSIPIWGEGRTFVFEADCLNVWNKNTFGSPNASWSSGSTSFGTISSASGARDWQFAGHINF